MGCFQSRIEVEISSNIQDYRTKHIYRLFATWCTNGKTLDWTANRGAFEPAVTGIVDQQELILERILFSTITEKVSSQSLVEQDLLDCGIVLLKQQKSQNYNKKEMASFPRVMTFSSNQTRVNQMLKASSSLSAFLVSQNAYFKESIGKTAGGKTWRGDSFCFNRESDKSSFDSKQF